MKLGYFICFCGGAALIPGFLLMVKLIKTGDLTALYFLEIVSLIIVLFVIGFSMIRVGVGKIIKGLLTRNTNQENKV